MFDPLTGKPVPPGPQSLGARKIDAFLRKLGIAFEGNMTPWNELTAEQFAEKVSFKLKQIGSDLMLLKNAESGIRKVIWFGTEPLPKELAEALAKANIPYWIIKP